jgi:hypothetical protein
MSYFVHIIKSSLIRKIQVELGTILRHDLLPPKTHHAASVG